MVVTRKPHRELHVRFPFRSVSDFIRSELLTGPKNPYNLYSRYITFLRAAGVPEQKLPTFHSFWNTHINPLKKLGLIRRAGRAVNLRTGKIVTLYRIVPGKEDDPLWEGYPRRKLAEIRGWKPVHLGKRRYRRRVLGVPPLPRGRPRRTQ